MSDLRTAAQQALEALERYQVKRQDFDRFADEITALRAALAQEQAGSWQDGVLEGHLRERERWLAQEQAEPEGGGRLPPPLRAEPVQEPVAVVGTQVDVWRGCGGRWAPPGEPIKTALMLKDMPVGTMLYTAPPRCPNCASLEAQNTELDRKLAEMEQDAPVQEPVAWRYKPMIGSPWSLSDDGYYVSCKRDKGYIVESLYTAPPQRKPLSLTDLQEALVLTNLIDRDAIDDSEEYDEGSTLAQIDELYRIIIKEQP